MGQVISLQGDRSRGMKNNAKKAVTSYGLKKLLLPKHKNRWPPKIKDQYPNQVRPGRHHYCLVFPIKIREVGRTKGRTIKSVEVASRLKIQKNRSSSNYWWPVNSEGCHMLRPTWLSRACRWSLRRAGRWVTGRGFAAPSRTLQLDRSTLEQSPSES